MEIYVGDVQDVAIDFPVAATSVDAVAYDQSGVALHTFGATIPDAIRAVEGGYSVTLPFHIVSYEGEYTIRWKITYTEAGSPRVFYHTAEISVVRPILSLSEVKAIMPGSPSDNDVAALERKVRLTIQAFTGQVFGKYIGTARVYGTGDRFLRLPRRLISLNAVGNYAENFMPLGYHITNDGWTIVRSDAHPMTIKQAPPDDILDYYNQIDSVNGVIYDPTRNSYGVFPANVLYSVEGQFGYESVPYDVEEAARLLVNDYACNESLYRERYIGNIRASDWRFEFNVKAYAGTGNVVADQLLSAYQRSNMVVI